MKERVFLLLIFFSLLFCFSLPAWSDDKNTEVDSTAYDLGEVLVIGGKQPTSMKIANTYEMTAEQIKETNSTTVADALSHVPGVQVKTGYKNQPVISLDGFNQVQVLVLIDGVPYYESKYHILDLNQLKTDVVDKIVVIKGAASVLYGANAEGGVINIITKKPVATPKPTISATTEMGDGGYNRESMSSGWKKGIFSYWVSYTRDELPSYRLSDDFSPTIGRLTYRPGTYSNDYLPYGPHGMFTNKELLQNYSDYRNNSYDRSNSVFGKVGIEPSPGSEYFANFFYITREKGVPLSIYSEMVPDPGAPAFSQLATIPRYDDWDIDLSGKQKICDQLTVQGKLFYHDHIDDFYSYFDKEIGTTGIYEPDWNKVESRSRYQDNVVGGKFFAEYQPISWDILRLSYHAQRDDHKQRDDENLPFAESWSYTTSMGLENEFNLIKNLSVVSGVSRDSFKVERAQYAIYNSSGDFTSMGYDSPGVTKYDTNPMGGFNYQLDEDTRIFSSVGRKSRYPTLNELYSGRSGGNPELQSEHSVNTTAGIEHQFCNVFRVQVAYFYHDVTNWISKNEPTVTGEYLNFGGVTMQGFEVNAEWKLPIKDLVLTFDYMYDDARDDSDGRVTNHVPEIPLQKVDAGVKYIVPTIGTKLNFDAIYIGNSYYSVPTISSPSPSNLISNGNQMTFNCRIAQTFWDHYEAYMAMNNMLDKNYMPEYGFPAEGRTWWLGLTAKF